MSTKNARLRARKRGSRPAPTSKPLAPAVIKRLQASKTKGEVLAILDEGSSMTLDELRKRVESL